MVGYEWFDRLGGRKVTFGMLAMAVLLGGMFVGVSDAVFASFTYGVIGVYAAMAGGNAGEHLAEAYKASKGAVDDQ